MVWQQHQVCRKLHVDSQTETYSIFTTNSYSWIPMMVNHHGFPMTKTPLEGQFGGVTLW